MLGMHPISALFGAHPPLSEPHAADTYVKALTEQGLHLMLCRPGSKTPWDVRSPREKDADQKAWDKWREDERAAGRTPPSSAKHPGGLYLASDDLKTVRKHLKSAYTHLHAERDELEVLRVRNDLCALEQNSNAVDADRAQYVLDTHAALADEYNALVADQPRKNTKKHQRMIRLEPLVNKTPLAEHEHARMDSLAENQRHPFPNLAVNVGDSNVVVVDCDTADQVQLFQQWAAYMSGDESWLRTAPTVSSPGVYRDGQWVHRDGGHYWFTIPTSPDKAFAPQVSDDDTRRKVTGTSTSSATDPASRVLPSSYGHVRPISEKDATTVTVSRDDGLSFDIFVNKHYVLVPPSRRDEGEYTAMGPSQDLPQWLFDYIMGDAMRRREERAAKERDRATRAGLSNDENDALDSWYNSVSWEDLLIPHGWTLTGTDQSCGCPTFGRPGYSSPKSATAHVPGCTHHTSDDPPIHFWSTAIDSNLESKIGEVGDASNRTLSKLQLFAALEHDGKDSGALRAALDSQGITASNSGMEIVSVENGIAMVSMGGTSAADEGPSEFSLTAAAPDAYSDDDPVDKSMAPPPTAGSAPSMAPAPQAAPASVPAPAPGQTGTVTSQSPIPAFASTPNVGLSQPYTPPTIPATEQQAPPFPQQQQQQNPAPAPAQGQMAPPPTFTSGIENYLDTDLAFDPATGTNLDEEGTWTPPEQKEELPRFRDTTLSTEPPAFRTLDTLIATRPPVKFLVQDMIQENTLSVVVGPSNAGKSAVLLDMLCTIAADKAEGDGKYGVWMGKKTKRRNILYVAGEGIDGVVNRVTAWEEVHQRQVRDHMLFTEEAFPLDAPEEAWLKFATNIKEQGIEVIVLDTLATMMTGLEENSNDDMGRVVTRLQRLAQWTETSIILVHHTGKNTENFSPRGASALTAAIASQILVQARDFESLDRQTQIEFESAKIKPIRVSVTKQKDAAYIDPMELTLVGGIPVPHREGLPTTNDFDEDIGYTTIMLGDANGDIVTSDGQAPVLETPTTPKRFESDTQGLAAKLVTRIANFGAGPVAKRQTSQLTRTRLEMDLFRRQQDESPEPLTRERFGLAFTDAVTLAIRAGAIRQDGTMLHPNVRTPQRVDMDYTLQTMLGLVRDSSADDMHTDPDAIPMTSTGGASDKTSETESPSVTGPSSDAPSGGEDADNQQ